MNKYCFCIRICDRLRVDLVSGHGAGQVHENVKVQRSVLFVRVCHRYVNLVT